MIESMMSFDPQSRPSVQMIIEATEMLINKHHELESQMEGQQESRALEMELDNRFQFMLIQKDQGTI